MTMYLLSMEKDLEKTKSTTKPNLIFYDLAFDKNPLDLVQFLNEMHLSRLTKALMLKANELFQ